MIEPQVPEAADGGYWYVVPAVVDETETTTAGITAPAWAAWYSEIDAVLYAAIRTDNAIAGLAQADPATVASVLAGDGYDYKPHARSGGA